MKPAYLFVPNDEYKLEKKCSYVAFGRFGDHLPGISRVHLK